MSMFNGCLYCVCLFVYVCILVRYYDKFKFKFHQENEKKLTLKEANSSYYRLTDIIYLKPIPIFSKFFH